MKAKTDAWMPLYVGDYLADTQHLSTLEHGAYLLLLMAYWRNKGPLPDDDVKLARIVRLPLKQWKKMRSNVIEFFQVGDGQLRSSRSDKQIEEVQNKSNKARSNALERWNRDDADALHPQCDGNADADAEMMLASARPSALKSESYNKTITISSEKPAKPENGFEAWYAAYPRRVDPGRARKAYASARKKTAPDVLLAAARAYAVECIGRETQFIKHPATWLNAEAWLNQSAATAPPSAAPFDPEAAKWEARVAMYRATGAWEDFYGPKPDEPGCRAPAPILARLAA